MIEPLPLIGELVRVKTANPDRLIRPDEWVPTGMGERIRFGAELLDALPETIEFYGHVARVWDTGSVHVVNNMTVTENGYEGPLTSITGMQWRLMVVPVADCHRGRWIREWQDETS